MQEAHHIVFTVHVLSCLKCMGKHHIFRHFIKEDNLCDFFFATFNDISLLK